MLLDKGFIVGGDTYGDTLAPGQIDAYSTPILAGITYDFDVTATNGVVPLTYAIAGPDGIEETGTVNSPHQTIQVTAPTNGVYSIGFETLNAAGGSFSFTSHPDGASNVDGGPLTAGHTYSDTLAPHQVDGYRAYVVAGVSYTLTLSADSSPLTYSMGTEHDPVSGTIQPGQTVTYTPTETGTFGMGISAVDWGAGGHYSFTIGGPVTAQPPGSESGPTTPPVTVDSPVTVNPPIPVDPPPAPTFTGEDMTTGQPLVGYGSSFAGISSDNLAVSTSVSDAFIMSGTGDDILHASGGGTNVLDDIGGTVNFEIGSTLGKNAFFLDASKNPVSWNTIASMHSGDFAVVYGIGPQSLANNAQDGMGVSGYTGLTLETYQNGGASFLTLAGFSKADLTSGKLSTAFGTDAGGTSFLLVAAA